MIRNTRCILRPTNAQGLTGDEESKTEKIAI
jgi:hypothetical protein